MLWSFFDTLGISAAGHGQLRYVFAALTGFVISLIAGAYLIRSFQEKEVFEDTSQPDHEGLDKIQSQKKNVPTMGGLMIVAGIFAALLLWSNLSSPYTINAILCMMGFGGLGLVDDYLKLHQPGSRGLKMRTKFILQIVVGVVVAYILFVNVSEVAGGKELLLPFCRTVSLDLDVFYFPWAVLVIVATCNAVNLADGLDGLAGGCTAIVSAAMLGLGFLMIHLGAGLEDAAEAGAGGAEMCVVAAAILGSALGFLWYNVHPAQVFMGDTGALAIGGLLGYIALVLKLEAALLLAGVIFFVDEVTVFLQIAIYKITHKRIFPIAPIHHYFQTGLKWPEQKITARLWIIAGLGALISFALIRLRGS